MPVKRSSKRGAPKPEAADPANTLADLQRAVAELGSSVELDPAELAALIGGALVATYRRAQVHDAANHDGLPTTLPDAPEGEIVAHVDIVTGLLGLERRFADGTTEALPEMAGDLARRAAQAVRGAVVSRLREVAKADVMRDAERQRGDLLDGIVERRQGRVWWLRIGEHWGILPPEEQMAGEELVMHQHLKVLVVDSRQRGEDAVMVVSRSHPQLLALLLAQEVPELQTGQVIIKAIAREAGRRAKVAVEAPRGDVDPRGSCIGPKGVRHRAVTTELGAEQVQIVAWSEDPATYIAAALTPATARSVDLDLATRTLPRA